MVQRIIDDIRGALDHDLYENEEIEVHPLRKEILSLLKYNFGSETEGGNSAHKVVSDYSNKGYLIDGFSDLSKLIDDPSVTGFGDFY